jgi:hypothetical protein
VCDGAAGVMCSGLREDGRLSRAFFRHGGLFHGERASTAPDPGARDRSSPSEATADPQAQRDLREQVQRDPAAKAARREDPERIVYIVEGGFNPNANRTMPATIGRCRYGYASLASAARDAPVARADAASATKDDPVEIRPAINTLGTTASC